MSISLEDIDSAAPDEQPDTDAPETEPEPVSDPRTTRRRFFTLGALATAAAVIPARKATAQRIVRPRVLTTRPKAPPAEGDSLIRLVRRITNGVTADELKLAKSLGFQRYLEYHLRPTAINDSAVQSFVAQNYPALTQDPNGLFNQDQNLLLRQLTESTLYRAAFSKRQLYERMVEFWSDHFNIYWYKVNYLKLIDEREVVRKHALGKFPDMLRASAHSPAMLEYLDNTRSRGRNVNQNYARELMELHTLGVDGGYTQTDVEEVTRCLTGWTIVSRGTFGFDPTGHDFTQKTVLGTVIPAMPASAGQGGIQDGETVLNMLLAHPSTAKFISTKMIRWLLQYEPPPALVTKVADVFTKTGGDIPSMIRAILTPANLLAAPAKYKQPYQLILSALRASPLSTLRSVNAVAVRQLQLVGQPLFLWEEPDGYPDEVDWWAGNVLQRWNFCAYLTGLTTGDIVFDVAALMQVNTADGVAEAINQRLFVGEIPSTLKAQLTGYLSAAPLTATRVREACALAMSSTSFQWY